MSTSELKRGQLSEYPIRGKRLGRHVLHDPRSRNYPAEMATKIVTVRHQRNVPIFDQGSLGSCTGNAAVGSVSTDPFARKGTPEEAVEIYAAATHLDQVYGTYPPDDTGSSGLAVMKAMKTRGWISSYAHSFGLEHTLLALVLRPGITGITWRDGCDHPDSHGVVQYIGNSRGGHEVELIGIDADARLVWFANSWGDGWGLEGYFAMSFDDYGKALADDGDATFGMP